MQADKIQLYNRYGNDVYFTSIGKKRYEFICSTPYIRLGIIEGKKKNFSFIDPEGGPMISIGNTLPIGIIKSISKVDKSYIIEVE